MNTLIVYGTKHGFTQKCVGLLKDKLSGNVVTVNLEKEVMPPLDGFDSVVVGSAVYVGKIQESVAKFIQNHQNELQQKPLALFLVAGNLDQMDVQMKAAFPESLLQHAAAVEHLGYAYNLKSLNFFERKIVQVIAKIKKNEEQIYQDKIDKIVSVLS